jgi:hypothetical protein
VEPIDEIDVRDAAFAVEERLAAGTERRVRRLVFRAQVRFRLDDSPGRGAAAVGNQDAAEQVARDQRRGTQVEAARKGYRPIAAIISSMRCRSVCSASARRRALSPIARAASGWAR